MTQYTSAPRLCLRESFSLAFIPILLIALAQFFSLAKAPGFSAGEILRFTLLTAGLFGTLALTAAPAEWIFWNFWARLLPARPSILFSGALSFVLFFLPAGFLVNATFLPGKLAPLSLAADFFLLLAAAGAAYLIRHFMRKFNVPAPAAAGAAFLSASLLASVLWQSRTIFGLSYKVFSEQFFFFIFAWGVSLFFCVLLTVSIQERLYRRGSFRFWPLYGILSALFLFFIFFVDFNFSPDLYSEIHGWLKILFYFTLQILIFSPCMHFPVWRQHQRNFAKNWLLLVFLVPAAIFSFLKFNPLGAAESLFLSAPNSYRAAVLKSFRAALDFDHDGFSFTLGGGDTDDTNFKISPLSREKQSDGIDQDGFGRDLTPERIRRFLDARDSFLTAKSPRSSAGRSKPPMILITVDTLPIANMSAYGYERDTTPNLKKLADDGALFTRAYSQSNYTVLSFYSILRGRYPVHISRDKLLYRIGPKSLLLPAIPAGEENHVLAVSSTFKDDPTFSLAEILQNSGYATIAYPNDRYSNYLSEIIGVRKGFAINFTNDPKDKANKAARFNDVKMTDLGIEAIKKYKNKPFFLWLHYYDHHSFEKHSQGKQWGNAAVDLYDSGILRVDEQIGRLLEALKQEGIYEKAVIAMTADHGCTLMLRKEMHGTDINADQVRAPLIIKVPGAKGGREITAAAGGIDLMPTFLDYAGLKIPGSVEGWSLRPLLDGNASGINRYLFVEGWRQKVSGMPYLDKKALIFHDHILIYDRLLNSFSFNKITGEGFNPVPHFGSNPLFRRLYRDLRSWIEYQESLRP